MSNKLQLKPQWVLRQFPDGRWTLTTENNHQEVTAEYAAILQKLVEGVDPDTLTDAEFQLTETLSERGFLNVDNHPHAPAWELCGANFHSVQEQLKHTTFKIEDSTSNGVGESIRELLVASGMVEDNAAPRLVLAISDSYQELPDIGARNVLPIVCNRMRVTVGPLQFPWSPSVRDATQKAEHYLPKPNYVLPPAFDALQRAWIAAYVLQFIGQTRLTVSRKFVEFNMGTQQLRTWNF